MLGSFEVPERSTLTTPVLLEQNSTRFAAQQWPHKWDAATTANYSLCAIGKGF